MPSMKRNKTVMVHDVSKIISESRPEKVYYIRTKRVYSQIARTSRNPKKKTECQTLIAALENASIVVIENGRQVKKDPPFVPMKAESVVKCFGKQIERLNYHSSICE